VRWRAEKPDGGNAEEHGEGSGNGDQGATRSRTASGEREGLHWEGVGGLRRNGGRWLGGHWRCGEPFRKGQFEARKLQIGISTCFQVGVGSTVDVVHREGRDRPLGAVDDEHREGSYAEGVVDETNGGMRTGGGESDEFEG
jgi:hypothetical protein